MTSTQTPLKVTQEKLPASQVGLEIEIPGVTSQQVYDKVLAKLLRNTAIPGFRKGKVPRHILMQQVGVGAIKAAALEELIDSSIKQAITQEKIPALGNLKLLSNFDTLLLVFEPGQPLTISASADVKPEIQLDHYTGLVVEYEPAQGDPDYVSKTLAYHQNERATLLPVEDRPAQAGDVALVSFSAILTETQAPIESAQAEDFQLELSQGEFLPDLIDGIIGMSTGETQEINVTFPEDYFDSDLAGKAAVFTVTLHELKEKELPPLDDGFAQEISEFKTLAELEEFLRKRQAADIEKTTLLNQEEALLDVLIEQMTVDLPATLIDREVNYVLTHALSRLESQGLDVVNNISEDILNTLREQARPEAIHQLKRTLALAHVAKQENITVAPEVVKQRMAEVLESVSGRRLDPQRLRDVVESELLEELTVKWLLEKSELKIAEPKPESAPEAPVETPAGSATVDVSATTIEPSSEPETPVIESVTEPEAEAATTSTQKVSIKRKKANPEATPES